MNKDLYIAALDNINAGDGFKEKTAQAMREALSEKPKSKAAKIRVKKSFGIAGLLFAFLVMMIFVPPLINRDSHYCDQDCDECGFEVSPLMEYNYGYYERLSEDFLRRVGFAGKVTEDDLGEQIMVLSQNSIDLPDYFGYQVYEYKPVNSKALLVVDKNGEFELFGFCNFFAVENSGSNILEVYNIQSSADIDRIEVIWPYGKNARGQVQEDVLNIIRNKEFIDRFITNYREMTDVSDEYYQAISDRERAKDNIDDVFINGISHVWYLNRSRYLDIKLKNGLSLRLAFYPEIGPYLTGYTAAYRIGDDLYNELLQVSQ
ncbi:MAG: hypothetical protein SCK29_11645 [Bacillota bacterium]|nr:hypothetical protein [Bacillota bacterium]MDW7684757.1 hypothetical protein [Bacillota bacterium]